MNIWKQVLVILTLLAAMMIPAAEAYAGSDTYITDHAGLLTEEERAELEAIALEACSDHAFRVYIYIMEDMKDQGFYDAESIGNAIYDSEHLGYGEYHDGILLFLSMAERDYSIIQEGYQLSYSRLDRIEEGLLEYLADDDWYRGFEYFLVQCYQSLDQSADVSTYQEEAAPVNAHDVEDTYVAGVFRVNLASAVMIPALICIVLVILHLRESKAGIMSSYMKEEDLYVTYRNDTHIDTTTRIITHSSSSGAGGRSRSGSRGRRSSRSGKF